MNPDSIAGASPPAVFLLKVQDTYLYAEVRGEGPPILIIGAADEDAEIYRAIAERLTGYTVVTYDRRGTRRSGRENWPDIGSDVHADDAAGLMTGLGFPSFSVLGASAGGIVALRLALRHPDRIGSALLYEPGFLTLATDGSAMLDLAERAVDDHLAAHPGDWRGAVGALGRSTAASADEATASLFEPPPGSEWYAERTDENAESLIRGDVALTREGVDEGALAAAAIPIRFASGSESPPLFREIAARLAGVRGDPVDVLPGLGHLSYFRPQLIADYIAEHLGAEPSRPPNA